MLGETAVVPCVQKGDETAYFWNRGDDFVNSTFVASMVLDIPNSKSDRYLVDRDGSLVIYNVTAEDEGMYHCRILSETNKCHGAVTIHVEGK